MFIRGRPVQLFVPEAMTGGYALSKVSPAPQVRQVWTNAVFQIFEFEKTYLIPFKAIHTSMFKDLKTGNKISLHKF